MDDTSRALVDAVAAAMTPARVQPFLPPARPFMVGGAQTFGMHRDYRSQMPIRSVPRAPSPTVMEIAAQLVHDGVVREVVVATMSPDGSMEVAIPGDGACVVCADILHRLADPRHALQSLQRVLASNSAARARVALISVPLREMPHHGELLGPPDDAAVARMWTFPELVACVEAFGLLPLFGGVCEGDGLIVVRS